MFLLCAWLRYRTRGGMHRFRACIYGNKQRHCVFEQLTRCQNRPARPRQYVCECTRCWHARYRRCMYTLAWKDELALARSLRWMAQLINRAPFAADTPGFPRGRAAAFWPSRRRFVTFFSTTLHDVMHGNDGNSKWTRRSRGIENREKSEKKRMAK